MQNKTTTVGTLAQTRARSTRIAATVFLIPTIVLVAVYIVYPILETFRLSMFKWNGLNAKLMENVGLDNWKFLLTDEIFWKSFGHNLVVMVLSILLQLPIGFLLATFLDALNRKKLGGALKTIWFLPNLMSSVAIAFLLYTRWLPTAVFSPLWRR